MSERPDAPAPLLARHAGPRPIALPAPGRLLLAGAIAAGLALLGDRPAAAGCTTTATIVTTARGDRLPRREVRCSEPSSSETRRRDARALDACRAAGFAQACDRLAAGRARAVERHLARLARARAAGRDPGPAAAARSDRVAGAAPQPAEPGAASDR